MRRDLRLNDNAALYHAHNSGKKVLPIFIFDTNILEELDTDDARVNFIYDSLLDIHQQLRTFGSSLKIYQGKPIEVWQQICDEFHIDTVYCNRDYEPYGINRDSQVKELLGTKDVHFQQFKDHVIFEAHEVLKADGRPYTVYTPYKNAWLARFKSESLTEFVPNDWNWLSLDVAFPDLSEIGFTKSSISVKPYRTDGLENYAKERDFPAISGTSQLSPYLRFGQVSVRSIIRQIQDNTSLLSELIWREFFMQILFHFPNAVSENFKPKYDQVKWRNDAVEFETWCKGETGYPMVDAGMRELNQTGYMHNRVRMIAAGFLCKHLLIDWRWGEQYFAKKLLDYELASNNGNWQWSAGTGCDAAPYFRIFNPETQLKKFDPNLVYVKKWIPEWNTPSYSKPMVDHKFARERALKAYRSGLS